MSSVYPNPAAISQFNVTMNKLKQAGFEVPPQQGFNKDKASFYLHQIAAYLREQDEHGAKNAARSLVKQWAADRD